MLGLGCGEDGGSPPDAAPDPPDGSTDASFDAVLGDASGDVTEDVSGGDGSRDAGSEELVWATDVVAAPGATGAGFLDERRAVDGVRGGGDSLGSTNVYSIREGRFLVLGFPGDPIGDGPGTDLVVFENPFVIGAGPNRFMDPTIVEVSADGVDFVAFPHDFLAADETAYSSRPEDWVSFAGVEPVRYHVEDNPVDPFSPDAGGDPFDLADLPGAQGEELRRLGIRFIRLSAASDATNPDTGMPFPKDNLSDGPDIDGVVARRSN